MYYTKDYVFEKIRTRLNRVKFFEKKNDDNSIFILEYKGKKARVDINSFLKKLSTKKSAESDEKVAEFVYYISENLLMQTKSFDTLTKEDIFKNVYPVIRSVSFNSEKLANIEHTAETKIFFGYNLANGYKFLENSLLSKLAISLDDLYSVSLKNLAKLPLKYNLDSVLENNFYFLNAKDGYDSARILDKNVLNYFYKKIGGAFYVGVPNQDVLIVADIKNKKGLEIMQKMMVHFFTDGLTPITTITFKYDGVKLESLFIFVE